MFWKPGLESVIILRYSRFSTALVSTSEEKKVCPCAVTNFGGSRRCECDHDNAPWFRCTAKKKFVV